MLANKDNRRDWHPTNAVKRSPKSAFGKVFPRSSCLDSIGEILEREEVENCRREFWESLNHPKNVQWKISVSLDYCVDY